MGNEKAVLFVGANRPIIGRENEAMGWWSESGAWLETQQKKGFFARWDAFWLTPHGGDLNCAFTFYGDRAKLDEWRRTDDFEAWIFRGTHCMENCGVIPGVTYAAGQETLARRKAALGK